MASGKAINLRVRPGDSVDLCFPVDGVIGYQPSSLLGIRVDAVNTERLYGLLPETADDDDSKLLWDSARITSYLKNEAGQASGRSGLTLLSRLRNVSEAADLDRALMMRQNAFLTTYSPEVLSEVRRVYHDNPGDQPAVRYRLLAEVEKDLAKLHDGLTSAYKKFGWAGKVRDHALSQYDNKATQYSGSSTVHFEGISDTWSWGYEFRYPSAENDLRYHQSRAAVRQEFLNAWRMSEMSRHWSTTFPNELGAIDQTIRKLQAAFVDTFLVAPPQVDMGLVTAVFREEGEYVRAGEPVVRVEQDLFVYLVGTVKYRGMLRVGSMLEVATTLFEEAGAAPTIVSGRVVAVRGHDSVSEQWDLLVQTEVENRTPTGDPILPLNYHFDLESTSVEVTAF